MSPSLRNLPYEERLSRLKLSTLEKRRNLIAVYRASKGLEKLKEMMCLCGTTEQQENRRRN